MPDASVQQTGNMISLFRILTQEFPDTVLSKVQRRAFNESDGLNVIRRLKLEECANLEKDLTNKLLSLHTLLSALISNFIGQNLPCSFQKYLPRDYTVEENYFPFF